MFYIVVICLFILKPFQMILCLQNDSVLFPKTKIESSTEEYIYSDMQILLKEFDFEHPYVISSKVLEAHGDTVKQIFKLGQFSKVVSNTR